MTTIYLSTPGHSELEAARTWDWSAKPLSILVSYAYLKLWEPVAGYFKPANLMLDSGAFTVHMKGGTVDVDDLIRVAADPRWNEVISLDDINDAAKSRANFDYMVANGCTRAMPVFHYGEPWHVLEYYLAHADKVGIGGIARMRKRPLLPWIEQVFARAWPKKLHVFGVVESDVLVRFPFHSADSSTWVVGPARYKLLPFKKRGKTINRHVPNNAPTPAVGRQLRCYGLQQWMDAMWHLEQRLRGRWAKELATLDDSKPKE